MNVVALGVAAVTLAGLLPPTPTPSPGGAAIGQPAPPFVVSGLDSRPIGPQTPLRHGLFVHFFTTACTTCRAEIPNLIAAYHRYRDRVTFLDVDEREAPSKVRRFVHEFHIPYDVGVDGGQVAATLGVTTLPHSLFIDRHGIVRAVTGSPLTSAQLKAQLTLIARN